MSRAAYDLQVRATVHSASCGHAGHVPDDYLGHLDGLGIETTITAAELCVIGTCQRAGGGYRILDPGKRSNMPWTGYVSAEVKTLRLWPPSQVVPGPAG